MMNFKVKVGNEAESQEVQELAFELGYGWHLGRVKESRNINVQYIYCYHKEKNITCGSIESNFINHDNKELTIQQLRDMVVLKRNDSKDANVCEDSDTGCFYDLYLTNDKELYFFFCGRGWTLSNLNSDESYYKLLKPIKKEKVVKEYLKKLEDGTYKLVVLDSVADGVEGLIEVPEGAEIYTTHKESNVFYKRGKGCYLDFYSDGEWCGGGYDEDDYNREMLLLGRTVRWQRSKEESIEAMEEAEDILIAKSLGGFETELAKGCDASVFKHSHYKKDVSHLDFIDVYRVLDLFEVESHAVGHAIKKLLCSGQRGAKDKQQDIQEAIDSLNRELEMMEENGNN